MVTANVDYLSRVTVTGLDENFPVAGVNNSSQGFRNNFGKIKSALSQTSVELTELRDYVLKKIEEGEIFSHDNTLNYYKLIKAQLKSYSETFYNIGEVDTVIPVSFLNGNFQKATLTKTADLSLNNFPSDHEAVGRVTLWVTINNVGHRIFIPGDMVYGTNTAYIQSGQIVFPSTGNYLLEIISVNNAGQFWLVAVQGLETGGVGGTTSYQLPTASVSTLGGVKVDGVTIGINNGIIRVIGGTGGGGTYAVGATGASGPPGPSGLVKTGSVYSYMYQGAKSTGNQARFHMATVTGVSGHGTIEMTLAHHHSGGDQHGAYARLAYATNAYTGLVELEKYEKSFDAGSMTGNVGFEITRPISGNLEIHWLGNVSYDLAYNFYMTINSNQNLTINKIGLD